MNVNFGLFPPLPERLHKSERKPAMVARARADFAAWTGDAVSQPEREAEPAL